MSEPAAEATAPRPGSLHFYAELYAPAPQRTLLRAVNALECGVRASLRTGLDHSVAHVRLEWWREEAARSAAGAPSHPLAARLADAAGAAALAATLQGWVAATELELAGARADALQRRAGIGHAGAERFALMARLLGGDAGAARALGRAVVLLHPGGAGADAARIAARSELAGLAPALQPPLRALLVWGVLALRRARRADPAPPEHAAIGRAARLGDNWLAWRAARAADAGRIQHLPEVQRP